MGEKKGTSGQRRAVRTPKPATRKTPRPGHPSPRKGGQAAVGVERHSRYAMKRSSSNPAMLAIVGVGVLGLAGIVIYAFATHESPAPPGSDGPVGDATAPRLTAHPPNPPPPAAMRPASGGATGAPRASGPKRARAPRIGRVQGKITEQGKDERRVPLSCGACGAEISKGDNKCPSCSAPIDWPESIDCPFCFKEAGSGICAHCRGQEPKRMMSIVFTCPSCNGTKKCGRCRGTGKYEFR